MSVTPTPASPFVFTAALAIDPATVKRVPEALTITDETAIVIDRLTARLAANGVGLEHVVKTTCYLRDESYRTEFINAYRDLLGPAPYPVRSTVVLGLAGDCRIQIEAVAARPVGALTTTPGPAAPTR